MDRLTPHGSQAVFLLTTSLYLSNVVKWGEPRAGWRKGNRTFITVRAE